MNISECFQLGIIVKPHGLDGTVSVKLDSDQPEYYQDIRSILLQIGNQLVPYQISRLEIQGDRARMKFESVVTIEGAEELRQIPLFLPLTALPQLADDQFYFHEVIGYELVDESLGPIGVVTAINDQSAQTLILADHNGKEIMIPLTDELVPGIDKAKKVLYTNLPQGLLEL